MKPLRIQVDAYSGYKAEERPRQFVLGDHTYQVLEVTDQWQGPDSVYFKVRASDQNIYILRYCPASDQWSLESFRQASTEPFPAARPRSHRAG
ncbi:MAG: hypothetical protein HY647_03865 [Acidobacteria bacterium]|nr:hypothetical protein [Acidobacteriota bacterium]